ncbi:hypothetical protein [Billgrantia montanilacus]|nr:hypothetical protein [Halomonas montanilacus]
MTPEIWLRLNAAKLGSPFEGMFIKQVLAHLPGVDFAHLQAQAPFQDIDGRQRYCDFSYEVPGHFKLAIEIDGFDKRGTGTGMTHEDFVDWQRRHAALVSQGWDVLRIANRDVRDHPQRCLQYLTLIMKQSQLGQLNRADQGSLGELQRSLQGAQAAQESAKAKGESLEGALLEAHKHVETLNNETRTLKTSVWAFAFVLVAALGIFTFKDVLLNREQTTTLMPRAYSSAGGDSCANPISWEEAGQHVGQRKALMGPVVQFTTRESVSGSPTFITLGVAYPDPARFTLVIWGNDRSKFQSILSHGNDLLSRKVCAVGVIGEYRGQPQIILSEPDQVAF